MFPDLLQDSVSNEIDESSDVELSYLEREDIYRSLSIITEHFVFRGLIGDFMVGTLTIPYVFFPLIAGTPLGILTKFFNMNAFFQTYVAVACIGEVGSSIAFMFENRQYQTVTSSLKITSDTWRRVFYTVNLLVPFVAALVIFLRIPNQDWAKLEMVKVVPCPTVEFYRLPTIVVTTEAKSIGFVLMFLLLFYFGEAGFFVFHASFYLCISTKSYTVSTKTKRLKQKYLVAVCIQIMVPLIIIAIPVGYFAFSIISDFYSQKANNFCFLIMSIHGFLATVATLLIYENYRNEVLRILRIKKDFKVTLIATKSMAETTYI